jgi:hypothetical protein
MSSSVFIAPPGSTTELDRILKNFIIMLDEVVRFSPNIIIISIVTLYFLFKDQRALILLFGVVINWLLNFFLQFLIKAKRADLNNSGCSSFFNLSIDVNSEYINPDYISQSIAFFVGFFFANMHFSRKYNVKTILLLLFILAITGYQRILSKCVEFIHIIIGLIVGFTFGFAYYKIMSISYSKYDNTSSESVYTCNYVQNNQATNIKTSI